MCGLSVALGLVALLGQAAAAVAPATSMHLHMATEFLMTPTALLSAERLAAIEATRARATGFEIRTFGAPLCGGTATANVRFVDGQCQRCPDCPPTTPTQPDAIWVADRPADLTWVDVCGAGLAWAWDAAAGRPLCTPAEEAAAATPAFLTFYRPAQFATDFVYQISRIDCNFCKKATALAKQFSGTHPAYTHFDVQAELSAPALLTADGYEGIEFKTPAFDCNKPLFAGPLRPITWLDTSVQPRIHVVNASFADDYEYAWRRLTVDELPAAVLGTEAPPGGDDARACRVRGQAKREARMAAYFTRINAATARGAIADVRRAVHDSGCCAGDAGAAPCELGDGTSVATKVCLTVAGCESLGAHDLDAVECHAEAARRNATSLYEGALTHLALQYNQDLPSLSRRDTRKCFVENGAVRFARYPAGTDYTSVCKGCPATATDAESVAWRAPAAVHAPYASVADAIDDECRGATDATCGIAWPCGADGLACRRHTRAPCLSATPCASTGAVDLDQYECEHAFRRAHLNATGDPRTLYRVRERPITADVHAPDPRACLLRDDGAEYAETASAEAPPRWHACASAGEAVAASPVEYMEATYATCPPAPPPGTVDPAPPPVAADPAPPPPPASPVEVRQCPDPSEDYWDPCGYFGKETEPYCVHGQEWGACGSCNVILNIVNSNSETGCNTDADCTGCGCASAFGYTHGTCTHHRPVIAESSQVCNAAVCLEWLPVKQCLCHASYAHKEAYASALAHVRQLVSDGAVIPGGDTEAYVWQYHASIMPNVTTPDGERLR